MPSLQVWGVHSCTWLGNKSRVMSCFFFWLRTFPVSVRSNIMCMVQQLCNGILLTCGLGIECTCCFYLNGELFDSIPNVLEVDASILARSLIVVSNSDSCGSEHPYGIIGQSVQSCKQESQQNRQNIHNSPHREIQVCGTHTHTHGVTSANIRTVRIRHKLMLGGACGQKFLTIHVWAGRCATILHIRGVMDQLSLE